MFNHAIARRPGPNVALGLTTAGLGPPDFDLMRAQHAAYVSALESWGVTIDLLEADERFPDGCFVEDAAIVTPACIVLTRSGAPSRRGEELALEPLLARHGRLERIQAPGCVDGGDVIVMSDRALIGLSRRTNSEGARQLAAILARHDFATETVPVTGTLHLKSDVNRLDGDRLIMTATYASRDELATFDRLVVPRGEEYAANCLCCDQRILIADGFPGTRAMLERRGYAITALDTSEFRKMDGSLSCLSIRI